MILINCRNIASALIDLSWAHSPSQTHYPLEFQLRGVRIFPAPNSYPLHD